jgi:hypothetical protein
MAKNPELEIPAGTLRSLGGDSREHTMDSPAQKKIADAILNSTPLEVAKLLCREISDDTKLQVLQLMHARKILTKTQYDLIARGVGQVMEEKKLIAAQRLQNILLVGRVIEQAEVATRNCITKLLAPRMEDDGSLDILA